MFLFAYFNENSNNFSINRDSVGLHAPKRWLLDQPSSKPKDHQQGIKMMIIMVITQDDFLCDTFDNGQAKDQNI